MAEHTAEGGGAADAQSSDDEEVPRIPRKRKAQQQQQTLQEALTPGVPLQIESVEDVAQLVRAGASGQVRNWVDMSHSTLQMAKVVFKLECQELERQREALKAEIQTLQRERDTLSQEVQQLQQQRAEQ